MSIAKIRSLLEAKRDTKVAAGQKKYMKNTMKFYGFKAQPLETLFKEMCKSDLNSLNYRLQYTLAQDLFASDYFEEKEIAVKIWKKNFEEIR